MSFDFISEYQARELERKSTKKFSEYEIMKEQLAEYDLEDLLILDEIWQKIKITALSCVLLIVAGVGIRWAIVKYSKPEPLRIEIEANTKNQTL